MCVCLCAMHAIPMLVYIVQTKIAAYIYGILSLNGCHRFVDVRECTATSAVSSDARYCVRTNTAYEVD